MVKDIDIEIQYFLANDYFKRPIFIPRKVFSRIFFWQISNHQTKLSPSFRYREQISDFINDRLLSNVSYRKYEIRLKIRSIKTDCLTFLFSSPICSNVYTSNVTLYIKLFLYTNILIGLSFKLRTKGTSVLCYTISFKRRQMMLRNEVKKKRKFLLLIRSIK